ncbi:MAG: S-layer homology domain-containing protein [Oscillospiraceae bacterium]|nr:S-layer homology domain-containing protein [Oscillospiraceae bacterium]MBR2890161.1 S-layer homology domain-containing protein [Oscillospiraceae bacterium]
MRKSFLAVLTVIVLCFSLCVSVLAADHPFLDVPSGIWYEDSVEYVYRHGLMSGTGADRFSPMGTMTRGMVVTVLHRLSGSPAPQEACPFTDVSPEDYCYSAVCWAYEQNITNGTSDTLFSPSSYVTREQLVTFLYRCAGWLSVSTSYKLSVLSGYADAESVSTYALEPFSWAVTHGIIAGTDETHLSPVSGANRAQCAAILTRFHLLVSGSN